VLHPNTLTQTAQELAINQRKAQVAKAQTKAAAQGEETPYMSAITPATADAAKFLAAVTGGTPSQLLLQQPLFNLAPAAYVAAKVRAQQRGKGAAAAGGPAARKASTAAAGSPAGQRGGRKRSRAAAAADGSESELTGDETETDEGAMSLASDNTDEGASPVQGRQRRRGASKSCSKEGPLLASDTTCEGAGHDQVKRKRGAQGQPQQAAGGRTQQGGSSSGSGRGGARRALSTAAPHSRGIRAARSGACSAHEQQASSTYPQVE